MAIPGVVPGVTKRSKMFHVSLVLYPEQDHPLCIRPHSFYFAYNTAECWCCGSPRQHAFIATTEILCHAYLSSLEVPQVRGEQHVQELAVMIWSVVTRIAPILSVSAGPASACYSNKYRALTAHRRTRRSVHRLCKRALPYKHTQLVSVHSTQ